MAATLDPLGGGRRRRAGPRFRPRAEINVTPFVDVMLVLLVVFMVTAPLLSAGELVTLPQTTSDSLPQDDEPLAIQVTKDGQVAIQETVVPIDELAPRLKAIAAQGGKTADDRIYVYGDDVAGWGDVLRVMALVKDAGFSNFALVTDPVTQGKPDAKTQGKSGGAAGGKSGGGKPGGK